MKQQTSRTAISSRKQLQLTQVIGCINKQHEISWITSSRPVSGQGLKAIVYNCSMAPLLVVVPVNHPFTAGETKWMLELRELLVDTGASRRPLIFVGICSQSYDDRALQVALLNKLGVHTNHAFWLSDPSDFSLNEEIKTIVMQSLPPSQPACLEAEKLILLERCENIELMAYAKLLPCLSSMSHPANVARYLERRGIVMSFPLCSADESTTHGATEVAQSTVENTETIPSARLLTGDKSSDDDDDEAQLVLEPKPFSDKINELITICGAVYVEVNNCLVSSAQHGLIPKDKLKAKADASQLSLLPALHRSGLLLDPLLVACEHPDSSEAYIFSKATTEPPRQDDLVSDARHCFLVPSCLNEESRLSSLPGYCAVTPLAFRSPGCYQKDIPLSVFYQLVAYLMGRFPSSVKSCRYGARFHVAPLHILDITYATTYMKVVVYIHGQKQLHSSVTAGICASVRSLISAHLETFSKTEGTLVIHPAAMIDDSASVCPDFVDLPGVDLLSAKHEMHTIGGQLFSPSTDFCQWFGAELVQQHLDVLCYAWFLIRFFL